MTNRSKLFAALCVMALAACGQGGGGAGAPTAAGGACAVLTSADEVFGAGNQAVAASDIPGAEGSCSWASADGLRTGDAIVYSAAAMGSTTADQQVASLTQRWTEAGVTGAPLEGVGDSAQIAVALPGDQSQVVIRKGGDVITLVGTSGDPALTSEALVRLMATQAGAS